jgi:hypothetical protein
MTKDEKIVEDIINKMFELAGYEVTYDDIKGREDAWYTDWTMTMEQYEQWKSWGTDYIKKSLRMKNLAAEKQMSWFALNYGLKFSDL